MEVFLAGKQRQKWQQLAKRAMTCRDLQRRRRLFVDVGDEATSVTNLQAKEVGTCAEFPRGKCGLRSLSRGNAQTQSLGSRRGDRRNTDALIIRATKNLEKFRELAEWCGQICLRLQSTRDCCRNKVMLPEYSAIKFEPAQD